MSEPREITFRVTPLVTRCPACGENLRVRIALVEEGEKKKSTLRLPNEITIKGNLYKAGDYSVPTEIPQALANWLISKGFAEWVEKPEGK